MSLKHKINACINLLNWLFCISIRILLFVEEEGEKRRFYFSLQHAQPRLSLKLGFPAVGLEEVLFFLTHLAANDKNDNNAIF